MVSFLLLVVFAWVEAAALADWLPEWMMPRPDWTSIEL